MPIQPKQQPPYYQEGINIKEYIALISQSGTDAPTVVILKNTIGTITWSRISPGIYRGTKTGAFPDQNKVWSELVNNGGEGATEFASNWANQDSIQLTTQTGITGEDDWLNVTPLKIQVYV